jgi:hypothetical protein
MRTPLARRAFVAALLAACACAPPASTGHVPMSDPDPGVRTTGGNATVITGQDLRGGGPTLLVALTGRVNSLRVERPPSGGCPILHLRGRRTLERDMNPLVYIDGTLVGSTCALDEIRTGDIRQVEIYPGGNTTRSGYRHSPNGLLLVFTVNQAGV